MADGIQTWAERCETHPDHAGGMITHAMICARMPGGDRRTERGTCAALQRRPPHSRRHNRNGCCLTVGHVDHRTELKASTTGERECRGENQGEFHGLSFGSGWVESAVRYARMVSVSGCVPSGMYLSSGTDGSATHRRYRSRSQRVITLTSAGLSWWPDIESGQ